MLPVWLTDTVTPDMGRAMHYTLLWGLQGVELRTVGSAAERVPHVNQRQVAERLEANDMLPAAISPGLFEAPLSARARWMNDLATFGETVRFAERIGCPRVVVSAFGGEAGKGKRAEGVSEEVVDALRRAGEQAAPAGLTLAVRNETKGRHATGWSLARLLDAVAEATGRPGAVQAAWDPAAALRAGEDPAEGLRALGERVTLVRCSDGVTDRQAGTWQDASFGEGEVGWEEQLRLLRGSGFQGPLSLEVNVEPRPKEGLRAATRLIRMTRAAQRAEPAEAERTE
ncbi:MAG: sugar phosphate isomerase/epimerase [Bacteroidetes bacterium QS_8_68_28]|nr:MAG: sugar phosphate isomerase/epimerase [Bacteroidetes bacterium QS_8_68_28]